MDLGLLRVLIFPPCLMAVTLFQFTVVSKVSGPYRQNWRKIARSCKPTWAFYQRQWRTAARSHRPNWVSQHRNCKKIARKFCPTCDLREGIFHVLNMNCVWKLVCVCVCVRVRVCVCVVYILLIGMFQPILIRTSHKGNTKVELHMLFCTLITLSRSWLYHYLRVVLCWHCAVDSTWNSSPFLHGSRPA